MTNKTHAQILEAMQFRFACKEFDATKKIADEDFQVILEAGRLSPSSFGFEPWQFLVVQNAELRELIRSVSWGAQTQLPTASHFLVILSRKPAAMLPMSDYIQKTIMQETQHQPPDMQELRTQRYTKFLQTDFAYDGNERAAFEWAARQAYIVLGNMMTAAAMLGIDSCPCEGFQKETLESLLAERQLFDRETFGIACMAAFGFRAAPPKREKTRRPVEQVVRWFR
ncbi:MAG: NAD(P)H-dependent oxidoreductase [Planctomycetaceae bacterium]|nr:NAD(P)H-dependent oxidoreductase [Planctomycetaceae bacterium]